MPCCKFELELWRRYLFDSQHSYPFDLLFCGLVVIFLSRLFSLLSVLSPGALGYVLSRVGANMAWLQARRSQASLLIILMVFFSSELRAFSIRFKIPKVYVNIKPDVQTAYKPDFRSLVHTFESLPKSR